MPASEFEQLTVFFGELNPEQGHVYARLDAGDRLESVRLQGHISGPHNILTRTLPASVPLHDLGPGPSKLSRAILPDPCFWAPGEPYLYDVHLQLVNRTQNIYETDRCLGLRSFGVHRQQLLLKAEPWRLAAVEVSSVEQRDVAAWRTSGLAQLVTDPSDDQCDRASREGVLLIAQADGSHRGRFGKGDQEVESSRSGRHRCLA